MQKARVSIVPLAASQLPSSGPGPLGASPPGLVALHVDQLPLEERHQLPTGPRALHRSLRLGGGAMVALRLAQRRGTPHAATARSDCAARVASLSAATLHRGWGGHVRC